LKIHFIVDRVDFHTLLFANDKIITSKSEDKLQEAIYKLSQTVRKSNLNI